MTAPAWTPEVETRLVVAARGPGTHGLVERRVLAAALAEIARFKKLFDDAGQGEHNVLALIDYYQAQELAAWRRSEELEQALRGTARHCGMGGCEVETRGQATTGCAVADAALAGTARVEQGRDLCGGCGQEIDPECCWCGDDCRRGSDGSHPFIPMGCECGRARTPSETITMLRESVTRLVRRIRDDPGTARVESALRDLGSEYTSPPGLQEGVREVVDLMEALQKSMEPKP